MKKVICEIKLLRRCKIKKCRHGKWHKPENHFKFDCTAERTSICPDVNSKYNGCVLQPENIRDTIKLLEKIK